MGILVRKLYVLGGLPTKTFQSEFVGFCSWVSVFPQLLPQSHGFYFVRQRVRTGIWCGTLFSIIWHFKQIVSTEEIKPRGSSQLLWSSTLFLPHPNGCHSPTLWLKVQICSQACLCSDFYTRCPACDVRSYVLSWFGSMCMNTLCDFAMQKNAIFGTNAPHGLDFEDILKLT